MDFCKSLDIKFEVVSTSLLENKIVIQLKPLSAKVELRKAYYEILKKSSTNELHIEIYGNDVPDKKRYSVQSPLLQADDGHYSLDIPIDAYNDLPMKVFLHDTGIAEFGALRNCPSVVQSSENTASNVQSDQN